MMNKLHRATAGVLLAATLTACSESTQVDQTDPLLASVFEPRSSEVETLDDWFVRIAKDVPGFAGMYFDDAGQLELRLTDIQREVDARTALSQYPNRMSGVQISRVVKAEYDFLQMAGWMESLMAEAKALPGLVSLDIDEIRNRLVVGVENAEGVKRAQEKALQIGIPPGGIEVQIEKILDAHRDVEDEDRVSGADREMYQLTDLRERVRPTFGGLLFQSPGSRCSLGFNAIHQGRRVFATASHCSEVRANLDSTVFSQYDTTHSMVGTEYMDPYEHPSPPYCFPRCRYSDASLGEYYPSISATVGLIARTMGRSRDSGSTHLDPDNEFFFVTDSILYPFANQELQKMGERLGWTYGFVTQSCKTFSKWTGSGTVWFRCQYVVSGRTYIGDSGGPVFWWDGNPSTDLVSLAGIVWSTYNNDSFVMSPLGGLIGDFGSFDRVTYDTTFAPPPPPLTVTINGPNEVPPNQSCYYSSSVSGGSGGYTYQWVKNVLPIGTGSDVNVSTSTSNYLLKLTVWSGSGSTGSAQVSVDNTSSADPCFM